MPWMGGARIWPELKECVMCIVGVRIWGAVDLSASRSKGGIGALEAGETGWREGEARLRFRRQ